MLGSVGSFLSGAAANLLAALKRRDTRLHCRSSNHSRHRTTTGHSMQAHASEDRSTRFPAFRADGHQMRRCTSARPAAEIIQEVKTLAS